MNQSLHDIIRSHCRWQDPLPTGFAPSLRRLPGLRAVLFDVYGTLLISATGDLATVESSVRAAAVEEALATVGLLVDGPKTDLGEVLVQTIRDAHARATGRRHRVPRS